MGKIVVGYWDVRGLAEPIRYLLHYKNVPFEDKRYQLEERDVWEKEKFTLGLDFPNLPYYFDDKVKLTQSVTILRYLAKKYDFGGKTEEEKLRVSLAEQQIIDFRTAFYKVVYGPNYEEAKKEYLSKVPHSLKFIAAFLGDRKFLAGDSLSYVDFMAYDTFDYNVLLCKTVLDEFPTLKAYIERIRNLPELQAYLKSSTYVRWPFAAPFANFGGKGKIPE
ncbi:glutathione S-transferase class-mu 26 kDa isozyme 47 [Parasteatoda tepidariorum]|uniref:glutathione S-transferase class-mu 26 kDa isozyme 47 n=1 Tax=Parasteatoda tepidariorum TaxID=114398 RepID=UPI00077FCC8C|nr:glutathione S-transferase class-mu 26 kDa isozyme 47 [Parasteatoda tepidariorum]